MDIYLRPFGLILNKLKKKLELKTNQTKHCIGNRPEIQYSMDSILKIAENKVLHPYFINSFFHRISHDYPSAIEIVDFLVLQFFKRLYSSGALENTILIVLADHGNRFDAIRQTLIGRWEERMPFLTIFLPQKFRKLYPISYEVGSY